MTPADYCRAQGWQVGDVLQHEGDPPSIIAITAVALVWILAIEKGTVPEKTETVWFVDNSKWRKIGHVDPFADELVWP